MISAWHEYSNQQQLDFNSKSLDIMGSQQPYVIQLEDFGVIRVSGEDSLKFLQGQLSCDVIKLAQFNSCLGAYISIKGKVEFFGYVLKDPEGIYLLLPADNLAATLAELKKYAMFSKVTVTDASAQYLALAYHNPIEIELDCMYAHPVLSTAFNLTFLLWPVEKITLLLQDIQQHNITVLDPKHWQYLEISSSVPRISQELRSLYFAHDLSLEKINAINFTKGCYRGQEIVARMQHRGNIKRELKKFIIPTATSLTSTDEILTTTNNKAGTIINYMQLPNNSCLGLAVMRTEFLNEELYCAGQLIQLV